MPRGSKPGERRGGRKEGAANKKSREIADKAAAEGITPLEYMLNILRDENAEDPRRDDMAKAAAPYIHPRLQANTVTGPNNGPIAVAAEVTLRPQISKEEWLKAHCVGTAARPAK